MDLESSLGWTKRCIERVVSLAEMTLTQRAEINASYCPILLHQYQEVSSFMGLLGDGKLEDMTICQCTDTEGLKPAEIVSLYAEYMEAGCIKSY